MSKWIRTLGDAKEVGQELIAVCHNPACRHRQMVDLASVIHHVGAGHSLIPVRGQLHFSERMRCPVCRTKGMFIWIVEPKFSQPAFDGMGRAVHVWDRTGTTLISTIARSGHVQVAQAAYEAAVAAYPDRRITLQDRAMVLHDSRLKVVKGGKR